MPLALEAIRRLRDTAEPRMLDLPGVTGIDVGRRQIGGVSTSESAIRVYVEKKLPREALPEDQRIPSELEGARIDVIEHTFELHHTAAPLPDTARYDPLQGGISIGPCPAPARAGTLGCCVRDATTKQTLMLSSLHAMVGGASWQPGQAVSQPSRVDGGACPPDAAGTLLRAVLSDEVDGAVAELSGRRLVNSIVDLGVLRGVMAPSLGLRVAKRGRTTRRTFGVVDGIDLTVRVHTGSASGPLILRRQIGIVVDPLASRHFGLPGDSGAVVTDGRGMALGLYVAGSTDGRFGVANEFQRVLDALGVTLCRRVGKTALKEKMEGKEKPELGEKLAIKEKPEPLEKPAKEPKEKPEKEKEKEGKSEKDFKLEGKPEKPEPGEAKGWDPKDHTDWEIWKWKQETGMEPGKHEEGKIGDWGWPVPPEQGVPEDDLIDELEGEIDRLRHFIETRLRPNLSRGALKWEADEQDPASEADDGDEDEDDV